MILDDLTREFLNNKQYNDEITTAHANMDDIIKRYTSIDEISVFKMDYADALEELQNACLRHGFQKGYLCGLGCAVQLEEFKKGGKKNMIAEAKIEQELKYRMNKLGGIAYKFTSPGNAGVPDRIVIFPYKPPVFVELKTAKGKLSRLQEAQIRKIKKLGQEVHVIYGIQGLARFFVGQGYPGVAAQILARYSANYGEEI